MTKANCSHGEIKEIDKETRYCVECLSVLKQSNKWICVTQANKHLFLK